MFVCMNISGPNNWIRKSSDTMITFVLTESEFLKEDDNNAAVWCVCHYAFVALMLCCCIYVYVMRGKEKWPQIDAYAHNLYQEHLSSCLQAWYMLIEALVQRSLLHACLV